MSWTTVNDDGVIQVRASIDVDTEQDQIKELIAALGKYVKMDPNTSGTPRDVGSSLPYLWP